MIKQTSASVGYICNECGLPIVQKVNFFTGKDEIIRIKCGCKLSEMTLKVKNDAKIRLTIPCILCGANHIYTLSLSSIFSREVFHLTCSLLNVNIALIGSKPDLSKQMYEICNEINDIFMMYLDNNAEGDSNPDENDMDDDDDDFSAGIEQYDNGGFFENLHGENEINDAYKMHITNEKVSGDAEDTAIRFKNPEFYERTLFYISNLVKNKKVYCNCEYPNNISVTLEPDRIKLRCSACGCERYMKTSTTFDIEYASELESLYLDD